MKKTLKQKEIELNVFISENYTENEAFEKAKHMIQDYGTSEKHIRKCYQQKRLGSLIRRLSPLIFAYSTDSLEDKE